MTFCINFYCYLDPGATIPSIKVHGLGKKYQITTSLHQRYVIYDILKKQTINIDTFDIGIEGNTYPTLGHPTIKCKFLL